MVSVSANPNSTKWQTENTNEEKTILDERLNVLQSSPAGAERQNEELQLVRVNETREKFNLAKELKVIFLDEAFEIRKLARWILNSSVSSDSQKLKKLLIVMAFLMIMRMIYSMQ